MNKLESSLPRDALCQVWLKLVQCFCRRRFLNIFNIILHFRYNLPLEKGVALHLNKLESPFPKVLEKKILNIFNIILHFRYNLPLEKGVALHLNKLKSLPPKDALCHVWLILAQWLWRSWKCEKFTDEQTGRLTDGQRDDRQQAIRKTHELKTKLHIRLRWGISNI